MYGQPNKVDNRKPSFSFTSADELNILPHTMGEFNCMPKQAAGRGIAKKGKTFNVGEDGVFEKSTFSMLSQKVTGKRDV